MEYLIVIQYVIHVCDTLSLKLVAAIQYLNVPQGLNPRIARREVEHKH